MVSMEMCHVEITSDRAHQDIREARAFSVPLFPERCVALGSSCPSLGLRLSGWSLDSTFSAPSHSQLRRCRPPPRGQNPRCPLTLTAAVLG